MEPILREITPVILAYNEGPNIGRTLQKLTWASRILVIDSGSNDDTVEIAQRYSQVEVVRHTFVDLADQWNYGVRLVDSQWALTLDADYELSDALIEGLRALRPDAAVVGFSARFVYRSYGKPLRGSLYPARTVLFRAREGHHQMQGHTQRLVLRGPVCPLDGVIYHDDRKALARWLLSQQRYVREEADYLLSARRENLNTADRLRVMGWPAPIAVFLYTLVIKRCLFDGLPGWSYALQRAVVEALIALELMERRGAVPLSARRGETDIGNSNAATTDSPVNATKSVAP